MIDILTAAGEVYVALSLLDDAVRGIMSIIEKYLKLKGVKPPNES